MKFNEHLDIADIIELAFDKDFDSWVQSSLSLYLDYRYERWVFSPKNEGMVEVFIDDAELPSDDVEDFDEDCFEISMYMILNFLESLGITDGDGYMTELLPDYATERVLVYPLSDIVKDYKEDGGLFISEKLMED